MHMYVSHMYAVACGGPGAGGISNDEPPGKGAGLGTQDLSKSSLHLGNSHLQRLCILALSLILRGSIFDYWDGILGIGL